MHLFISGEWLLKKWIYFPCLYIFYTFAKLFSVNEHFIIL
jgi:hypothetical protein